MSIIYEALKKIQINFPAEPQALEEKPYSRLKVYFSHIIITLAGFLATALVYSYFVSRPRLSHPAETSSAKETAGKIMLTQSSPAQASPVLPESLNQKPVPEKEIPAPEQKTPLPTLILNGIFFSEQGSYALINNRIVREGDTLEGLSVKKIEPKEVVLADKDSTLKLSTDSP